MATIDYDSFQYYTFDDYVTWDDRWELIDGVAYAMSPAPYKKQGVLFYLIIEPNSEVAA